MYPNVVQRHLLLAFSIIFHRAFFHLWHVEGLNTKIGQFVQHLRTLKVSFHYLHFIHCILFYKFLTLEMQAFSNEIFFTIFSKRYNINCCSGERFCPWAFCAYVHWHYVHFFGGISETIPCLARTLSCTPLIQCRHGDQSKSDPFTSVYFKKNEIKTYSQYVLLRIHVYRIEKKIFYSVSWHPRL